MRWLLVLTLAACGSEHHDKPDAALQVDAPLADAPADAAVDAIVDAAPDAAPDAASSPTCTTGPTILVDTYPRRIESMANVGDVLYVAVYDPNNTSDAAVLAVDPATGASLAAPLATPVNAAVWPAADAAYAAEYRAGGSIWRLVPGQSPVELVTGRASPYLVTSDGTYVYWSELNPVQGQPEILQRRLIAGGNVEQVMTGCANPFRIVVDATDLYCLEFQQGIVLRAPKDGSAPASSVPYGGHVGEEYPAATLVGDATNLYLANFYNNPQVWSAAKPGGPFQVVTQSPDLGRYLGLAVTPSDFYVTNQEGYVEQINRSTHAVHKIQILDSATIGTPALDPILWQSQLFVAAEGWTTAGNRYVLHCAD